MSKIVIVLCIMCIMMVSGDTIDTLLTDVKEEALGKITYYQNDLNAIMNDIKTKGYPYYDVTKERGTKNNEAISKFNGITKGLLTLADAKEASKISTCLPNFDTLRDYLTTASNDIVTCDVPRMSASALDSIRNIIESAKTNLNKETQITECMVKKDTDKDKVDSIICMYKIKTSMSIITQTAKLEVKKKFKALTLADLTPDYKCVTDALATFNSEAENYKTTSEGCLNKP